MIYIYRAATKILVIDDDDDETVIIIHNIIHHTRVLIAHTKGIYYIGTHYNILYYTHI